MLVKSKTKHLPLPRVRREPPSLEEAAFAAVGLADDLEQQVEIAANLMDVEPDEVRPFVLQARAPRPAAGAARTAGLVTVRDRVVTVERTNVRRIVLPPRTAQRAG
jgi:hypothetical protein